MIITQQATHALPALHGAVRMDACITREQEDVALPLMIALGMIMVDVFVQRLAQRALAQKDPLGQALLLHPADPALRIGIQVRAARRQRQRLDLTRRWRETTGCISCRDHAADSDNPAGSRIPP